jgi:glucose 1-dehydrogenase
MRLRDRVAIVTSSTSGIGRATAERFVAEGARVTVTGRREAEGRAIEAALRDSAARQGAGDALYVQMDVSRAEDVRRAVAATVERWGRVDVLVNNAAAMVFKRVVDLDEAEWDQVLGVNLKGAFLCAKYCLPHMRRGSAIVNVSSVHAVATGPLVSAYAASKGGLEAFTRALAAEWDGEGIRVNAVRVGSVDTPMLWGNPNVKSGAEEVAGVGLGRPAEVAAVILFLASDEASFVSCAVLDVDGGRLAHLGSHQPTEGPSRGRDG